MALSDMKDNRFSEVNTAFLERLGYAREELVGRTSTELGLFVHPAQQRHVAEELASAGRVKNAELQVRRKDGKVLDGLFSGGILTNQGSRSFVTVMTDITEQVELRDRLESQRRRLRTIIDGVRLGTWEWNIQTGETVFNEQWAAILGYTLAELQPTTLDTWKRLALPEDLAVSEELLAKHFAGETDHYELEARMRHKDGSLVWVFDWGKVTEWAADGLPLNMFGTHLDISERKKLQNTVPLPS